MVVIVINCVKIDNYHYFASSALFQIDAFKEVRSPDRTLIEAKIHIGTQASHLHPCKQRAMWGALCGVPANNVQWGALPAGSPLTTCSGVRSAESPQTTCSGVRSADVSEQSEGCHTSGLLTKRDCLTLLDSPLTNVKQI